MASKLKQVMETAAATKVAAEKAAAEAIVTPEQKKQLDDTTAAENANMAKVAQLKALIEKLNAAKNRA